jgi:galactosyl transferase GMA12/MNN10 family
MNPDTKPTSHPPALAVEDISVSRLEQWWAEGRWAELVTAETQLNDHSQREGALLLFFAVAHLQVGKTSKAKYLVQKALSQGCEREIATQALLAASVEKLTTIKGFDQDAPAPDDDPLERARLSRLAVLQAVQQARQTEPPKAAPAAAGNRPTSTAVAPTTVERISTHSTVTAKRDATSPRIGILSGYYPGTRFNSQVNHRLYAHRHGYRYVFDPTPRFDPRTYMRKLEAVQEYLELFDWLFWIDDDAYFTNFSIPLESFIELAPDADFIVCKSPSTKALSTRISSGQFLLRNTARSHRFVAAALATDLTQVQAWWGSHLGLFTKGDQDALVYLMETDPMFAAPFCSILDHQHFNNRDFEYESRLEEHFLLHFTGKKKVQDKLRFCERMGVNEYICPPDLIHTLALR